MIPKIIHYCWFGYNQKPRSVEKCIQSWKRYMPDYQIVEWNEKNYDIQAAPLYVRQAYDARKWAFVTDYVRLWIIYNYGGVYLDTDVEVIRSWNQLLSHRCFIGRQPGYQVNTGAGFGAEKKHPAIKRMMDDYENIPFIDESGEMDLLTCPSRNSQWLFECGLQKEDVYQEIEGVAIYPINYFSPMDAWTRRLKVTKNTYSIHHCDASWSNTETKQLKRKRKAESYKADAIDFVKHIPNRICIFVLGRKRYYALKKKIKGEQL